MTLQQSLLEWFHQNTRPLPWRQTYDPYQVWVSEIMLQQTQMDTVLPYFRRWMDSFPDIASLARSDEKKVLKAWEGLGYYSRARNLHESAKRIVNEFGGEFPQKYEDILSLKGIGRYSAGAIASIAFNQRRPIVDGNILRVLSRVYAIKKPIDVEKNKALFWKLEEDLIPDGQARHFNQALMELGALVCTAKNPACAVCPIKNLCRATRQKNPEDYPVRARKKKMVKVTAAALVLKKKNRYLIRLRPLGKIMGGLWEFPEWKLEKVEKGTAPFLEKGAVPFSRLKRLAKRDFGLNLEQLKRLGMIKRNYTHHLETLHVFESNANGSAKMSLPWKTAWASKTDFKKYPFSSAHAKITRLL